MIPVDQLANALNYFHRHRVPALTLKTGQVLRDVLRMLGVVRPDMETFEMEKHTLYIFWNEEISQQCHFVTIRRLTALDAPLSGIYHLQRVRR